MSIFTQIRNRLQKLERMMPTHTTLPTNEGNLHDPVFAHELPQKFSSLTGNGCEEGSSETLILYKLLPNDTSDTSLHQSSSFPYALMDRFLFLSWT